MDETEPNQLRSTQESLLAEIRELTSALKTHDDNFRSLVESSQAKLDAVMEKLALIANEASHPLTPKGGDKAAGWIKLPDDEKLKAADLRTALLLGKVPETAGLLIDTKTTAHLLNVSSSTLSRLDDLQAIPQPIRVGGTIIRWRLGEILAWIEAGCPFRHHWTYPEESTPTKRRR